MNNRFLAFAPGASYVASQWSTVVESSLVVQPRFDVDVYTARSTMNLVGKTTKKGMGLSHDKTDPSYLDPPVYPSGNLNGDTVIDIHSKDAHLALYVRLRFRDGTR